MEQAAFDEAVKESVDAGVAPLELRFFPVVEFDTAKPLAYRTKTVIHSVLLGELPEDKYTYVTDRREVGKALLQHNVQHMITALRRFEKARRNVNYLSVRCPAEMVENADLYEAFSEVLQKNPNIDPQKICLEFPATLLAQNTERAHTALKDMKLLHIRTALVGCGTETFPMAKLLTVTPDVVVLDPAASAWAGSRDKPRLFSSLVSYIKSMDIEVVAEGPDQLRKQMRGSDIDGFIDCDAAGISLKEALAQKEDDDEWA